jgi:AmiR/NasT family two-component response regulator
MQAFRVLCDAYLVKPIDTAKLLNQIREFHLI